MTVDNVLLVTIDSLRYDRVLGDRGVDPAPTISRLAESGTSFTNAFSNGPNTPTSFPSILTSTYPLMYGGYDYLDDRRPFLSETLADAGLSTVGYHSNPHLGPQQNYNSGFQNFNDGAEEDDDARTIKNFVDANLDPDSRLYRLLRRVWHYFTMKTDSSAYVKAPEITDRAIDWLDDTWDGETPYFMWLHYMDVHYPFTPPDEFVSEIGAEPPSTRRTADLNGKMQENPEQLSEADRGTLLDLYDGEIRYMDHHLGRLVDRLEALDERENTAIVVTADHGEAFGEHDRYGHHEYMYDELMHVPLVVDVPGRAGRTVEEQVSLIDIGPTVCDLVGTDVPEAVQGESLDPYLSGESSEDRTLIGTSSQGDRLAVRTPSWKFLWHRADERVELYDLESDPEERRDVSDDRPEEVSRFRERLEEYLEEAAATNTELPDIDESPETKQRLKDLGYVD
ncbi:sulfatase-like hydrolase/transferase [Halorientalis pallida]|uniref:sulfatase-like hydrolase/transferase n=1 Tax=Halorientalis pallida TaxID=2479928 RepID=UPI003C705482